MRFIKWWLVVGAAMAFAVAATGATASEQRAEAGQGYKVVGKWGKTGTGNGQLSSNTHGIDVDKAGLVYVADTDNNRIQAFSADGKFLRKWGSIGDGNGQFVAAEDLNIASDGTVWAADQQNGRLQAFSPSGAFKTAVRVPDGESPRGVGVAADGSVLAAVEGGELGGVRRYVEKPTGWEQVGGLIGSGDYRPDDVEGSPDGTMWALTSRSQLPYETFMRHYTAEGKALGSFKLVFGSAFGFGVDPDCNLWVPDRANRRLTKYSPSGKPLATASSPDLVANDVAVSAKGDLYAIHQNTGIVHFAEDRSKPATANVPGRITVKGAKATIRYGAGGFACPAQVDAVATLKGKGVSGKATAKVAAGKLTPIAMSVKGPAGQSVKATFTIVLKTNGRPTTETKSVTVSFAK